MELELELELILGRRRPHQHAPLLLHRQPLFCSWWLVMQHAREGASEGGTAERRPRTMRQQSCNVRPPG